MFCIYFQATFLLSPAVKILLGTSGQRCWSWCCDFCLLAKISSSFRVTYAWKSAYSGGSHKCRGYGDHCGILVRNKSFPQQLSQGKDLQSSSGYGWSKQTIDGILSGVPNYNWPFDCSLALISANFAVESFPLNPGMYQTARGICMTLYQAAIVRNFRLQSS